MKYIIFITVFAAMSILGFILMWVDKRRAVHNKWRIRELTLFVVAFLGGGVGTILGMYLFRHKTKHKSFVIGLPLITIISITIATLILLLIN